MTDEQIAEAKELRRQGVSCRDIGRIYGVSHSTILSRTDDALRARQRKTFNAKRKDNPQWAAEQDAKRCARHKDRLANDPEYRDAINRRARVLYRERYSAQLKKKRIDDPEWAAQQNRRAREWRLKQISEDPEFRARQNAKIQKRRRTDPEWAEKKAKQAREWDRKRMADPEYRAKRNRDYRARLANDPDFRAKRNAQNAARYRFRRRTDSEFRQREGMQQKERYEKTGGNQKYNGIRRAEVVRLLVVRDGIHCRECGGLMDRNDLHIDHYRPVSRAQEMGMSVHNLNHIDNLQLLHPACNISKHDRIPGEGRPMTPQSQA